MVRKRRAFLPGYFYHIVCRGNRKEPLFLQDSDFRVFFYILNQIHEKYPFEIASYCLMTNHYHLQLRPLDPQLSISKIMSLLNKRYASYYNNRYGLTGHVFEKRFFAQLIEPKIGMLEVSYYIHLNPVTAGIVKKCKSYPWSSSHLYYNPLKKIPPFMNLNSILNLYQGSDPQKRANYLQSLQTKMLEATLPEIND
ncbi:transposase [Jeotgalibacillus proteolyticus]|uniref:Transposase n=1 Tax=Jeotgalibacillus proteolyticus TaxID=2082395 RepID=A0A2S5GBJ7_9BACL|nr:transposase [Jeotgalibacillus proteolyticus]PPA70376.1 transposase [Jeotgalibacillus proteolyticus]